MSSNHDAIIVNKLSPERRKLLETMQNGSYDTITDLCNAAGVTRNVYYDALRSKQFVDTLFHESSGSIYAAIPDIMKDITKKAKRGSFAHQQMILEMVKLYGDNKPQVAIQNNISFQWKE
ncbi:MAG: hypothetical protein BWY74_00345 [Firmicutes bacterium ADurb.Bin419]|nr:MAG: hypothetical protein BWY74_00345 [Firmicutes bacterium ADurb.Bin419]